MVIVVIFLSLILIDLLSVVVYNLCSYHGCELWRKEFHSILNWKWKCHNHNLPLIDFWMFPCKGRSAPVRQGRAHDMNTVIVRLLRDVYKREGLV